MCIRRIQKSELQYCFSFWDFKYNMEKRKRIECEIVDNTRRMYAFVLNDQYIAGMSLRPVDQKTIYLSYLVVQEKWRNQGIGTQMIEYACQTSKQEGYSYIVLTVNQDNTKAEKLYKRLGFVVSGKNCERVELRIAL